MANGGCAFEPASLRFLATISIPTNIQRSLFPAANRSDTEIPHPHFRALEADAEDSLLLGETLALRGPLWAETTKTKAHFLVRAKTTTVRQRLYIFVTPTLPSPSEMK